MDLLAILKAVGPALISLLSNVATSLKTDEPPAPSGTTPHPVEAIRHLQALLNVALGLNPPLREDGWLGPKTEAAIEAGIVKLRSFGIG